MTLALARFEEVDNPGNGQDVMFNPTSLKVTIGNKIQGEEAGGGGKSDPKQSPQASSAKMETELVFDTTDLGTDVRDSLQTLARMAVVPKSDHIDPPKHVCFRWGRYAFMGVIENVTATYDFWSAEGVPLRATVQLTLTSLDGIGSRLAQGSEGVKVSFGTAPPNGALSTMIATLCGDANAGRALAAANGLESMRMGAGAGGGGVLAVSGGVELKAAAGFSAGASAGIGISAGAGIGVGVSAGASASAGAGFGIGASASAGASAGFGAGAGAGFSAGASAGFSAGASAGAGFGAGASAGAGFSAGASAGFGASAGASVGFGASASAGVSAGGGAFAGLGVSKSTTLSARLDPSRLLSTTTVTTVGSGSRFDVTGRVISGGSAGLSVGGGYATAGVRIG